VQKIIDQLNQLTARLRNLRNHIWFSVAAVYDRRRLK
jgi:hypothetical protein